ATVCREAQPDVRSADELHDLMLDLGALPDATAREKAFGDWLAGLVKSGRAATLRGRAGHPRGAAGERSLAAVVWPAWRFDPEIVEPGGAREIDRDVALAEALRGHLAIRGPVTAAELARDLSVDEGDIDIALARLELDGGILRGHFRRGVAGLEWCD